MYDGANNDNNNCLYKEYEL